MGDCSVHSLATDFRCSYHGFTLISTQVIVFLLDLGITKCFMKFLFNFQRVLLAMRGCSRTLKTPLFSTLGYRHRCSRLVHCSLLTTVLPRFPAGQGFKMGPVFGEVLQRLVDGQRSEFDLSSFALSRFDPSACRQASL